MNELDRNPRTGPGAPAASMPTEPAKPTKPTKPMSFHRGLAGRLRTYFLTGLVLVGPAYITISLTWWFINWVDDLVRPFIPVAYQPTTYFPVKIPGTGLVIALATLTLLGFLTANFIGRKLVEIGENILNRMPVVRPIYKSLKQIFETFFAKGGSSFRRVGLVEFPSPGMWSLVFLSQPGQRGHRRAAAGHRTRRRVHALHAQPDHRILLLRAAPRRHRPRYHRRSGDDAVDVGRHGAARRRRPAEEARRLGRDRARRADGAGEPHHRAGELTGRIAVAHPARNSLIASSRSNR